MERSLRAALVLAACGMLAAFCSPTAADTVNVPTGSWGGEHIAMEVTSNGAAIEFDCAHGTVDSALVLDSDGRFNLMGTFTRESPGPARQDQPPQTEPARYRGSMKDSTLTLTIELVNTNETIGVFTVTHDAPARITKCK
jgi:hypothetical protein